jgi:hypothetical protein
MPTFYDFTTKTLDFIADYYRKVKLKLYKKKKIKKSTTAIPKQYHIKYQICIDDINNPQCSEIYETVVPARAMFYAKILLERTIKNKMFIKFDSSTELSDEEYLLYLDSINEYAEKSEQAQIK